MTQSRLDDVDEYIEARQRRRARLAAAESGGPERRRRDLMRAEFDWSDAPRRSRRRQTAGLHASDDPAWAADAGPSWADEMLAELPSSDPGYRGDRHLAALRDPVGGSAPAEESWEDERDPRAAPSAEVLTRAWDDAVEGRLVETVITSQADGSDGSVQPGAAAHLSEPGPPQRRTIVITGHGGDLRLRSPRGYDARVPYHERSSFKPDRMAMWAVLLGLAMLLAAATSSHAAVLHAVAQLH